MNRVETATLEEQISDLLPADAIQPSGPIDGKCERPRLFEPDSPLASFMPMHYEQGYAYPLLIWLHGAGLDEDCLPRLMPHVSLRNYVAVAPRGTCREMDDRGYTWHQDVASIDAAEEVVADAIHRAAQRFHINRQRILIAGQGSGGTMAMRIALRRPDYFAGVASLAGPLPRRHRPFRAINQLRDLPMLIASGRESTGYNQKAVCDDLRLLHSAGCKLCIRQYPDDELTDTMLDDLNHWMMSVVCGSKLASCKSAE